MSPLPSVRSWEVYIILFGEGTTKIYNLRCRGGDSERCGHDSSYRHTKGSVVIRRGTHSEDVEIGRHLSVPITVCMLMGSLSLLVWRGDDVILQLQI